MASHGAQDAARLSARASSSCSASWLRGKPGTSARPRALLSLPGMAKIERAKMQRLMSPRAPDTLAAVLSKGLKRHAFSLCFSMLDPYRTPLSSPWVFPSFIFFPLFLFFHLCHFSSFPFSVPIALGFPSRPRRGHAALRQAWAPQAGGSQSARAALAPSPSPTLGTENKSRNNKPKKNTKHIDVKHLERDRSQELRMSPRIQILTATDRNVALGRRFFQHVPEAADKRAEPWFSLRHLRQSRSPLGVGLRKVHRREARWCIISISEALPKRWQWQSSFKVKRL